MWGGGQQMKAWKLHGEGNKRAETGGRESAGLGRAPASRSTHTLTLLFTSPLPFKARPQKPLLARFHSRLDALRVPFMAGKERIAFRALPDKLTTVRTAQTGGKCACRRLSFAFLATEGTTG